MKDVSDVVLGGIDAVNHADQNRLSGGNGDRPVGRDRLRLREGSRCRSWSERWRRSRGVAAVVCERQCHNVVDAKSLNVSLYLKTQYRLCTAKIAALQDPAILQFQCVGGRDCYKQKSQGGCGNKTYEALHCDSPLDDGARRYSRFSPTGHENCLTQNRASRLTILLPFDVAAGPEDVFF